MVLFREKTNKQNSLDFLFSKTRLRFLARLALVAAMLVLAKINKKLCLRILFVSPFHCVKPRAIISFGKLLLQQFFVASSNFQSILLQSATHTHTHTHTQRKTNTQNKTKTVYPQNYTETKELHTLQINAPFNCLKQDIIARASRVQKWAKGRRGSFVNAKNAEKFFTQVPLVLIYMIEKSQIWADNG